MYLILWRICSYYLKVIDRLFLAGYRFHFLFSKIFSAQFTVISANAKVYCAEFKKNTICESFANYFPSESFCTQKFLSLKYASSRERISTLFREQVVTVISILTALSIIISKIAIDITRIFRGDGPAASWSSPPKNEGALKIG